MDGKTLYEAIDTHVKQYVWCSRIETACFKPVL